MTKKLTDLTMPFLALFILVLVAGCGLFSSSPSKPAGTSGSTGGTGWKVWVKTSPCSGGRTDWVSVAQRNPTEGGGGGYWQTADLILSPTRCTSVADDSCTFADANASAATIRASDKFTGYCCRDYSVWQNSASGERSVVKGSGTAGFGWMLEKASLCCEEAETLAGKPGVCRGSASTAPPLGPISRKPSGNSNVTTTQNNEAIANSTDSRDTTTYQTPTPVAPANRWTLISVTVTPETPRQGDLKWSYNAQSSSAHLAVYNGDSADFQWTKPPDQIDENGFTISISTQCKSQPNNRNSSLIGVSAEGLTSDTPATERKADAYGENGAIGSKQKSVTFKPSPNANELQVEIGLGWGDVRFIYKYRRAG